MVSMIMSSRGSQGSRVKGTRFGLARGGRYVVKKRVERCEKQERKESLIFLAAPIPEAFNYGLRHNKNNE